MPKKLGQFTGRLTPKQIADGIHAARDNASRLAADARVLLDLERHPTAAALAILAIEELGKVSILRNLSTASDEELGSIWREYRTHTKKNAAWILPQLASQGAKTLGDFRPLFDPSAEHPIVIDQIKQLGFYTDCLANAHWSIPIEVIDAKLASTLVRTAEGLSLGRRVTEREIELWIEHLGPVWNQDMSWMKKAVRNWYEALSREGLLDDVSLAEVSAFLGFDNEQE